MWRCWLQALAALAAAAATRPDVVSVRLDWETGTVDSGLAEPLKPSFSINGDSYVPPKNPYGADCLANPSNAECWPASINETSVDGGKAIHSLSVEEVTWARDGTHVLKVYADGRNFETSQDYPKRSELSAVQDQYIFLAGDHHFFTMSFWPDSSWDQVSKYSILIAQWKMSPSLPHAALRLSNLGDYKLFFRGYDLWEAEDGNGKFIGYAKPAAWNDIKVYFKKSLGSDGVAKVWLNGALVFDHSGATLLTDTARGYTKFGMYTEIRDERTIYFDAVHFCHSATMAPCLEGKTFEEWAADQAHLPTVAVTMPQDGAHVTSGSSVEVVANAQDPGGQKSGTSGAIAQVEFYAGECSNESIGIVTAAPFAKTFAPADGAHILTAVATDSDGNVATSDRVRIHVGNKPPVVEIQSPVPLQNLGSSSETTITVIASDPDGSIAQVSLFDGDAQLGIAAASSGGAYILSWQPSAGAHELSAVATDGSGAVSTSSVVQVTVDATIENVTLRALEDASLREERPTSTANWGLVEIYGKPDGQIVGIFKFDISSLQGKAQVRSAKLKLFATEINSNAESGITLAVFSSSSSWEEASVTWSNGPSRGNRLGSFTTNQVQLNEYLEIDVTSYIADSFQTLQAVTLWVEEADVTSKQIKFESSRDDKVNPPQLQIMTSSIAAFPTGSLQECSLVSVSSTSMGANTADATSSSTTSTTSTTPVATENCDAALETCRTHCCSWSHGKNGCQAYAKGWLEGNNTCHKCLPTSRNYAPASLMECHALCEELVSALDNQGDCKKGCDYMASSNALCGQDLNGAQSAGNLVIILCMVSTFLLSL